MAASPEGRGTFGARIHLDMFVSVFCSPPALPASVGSRHSRSGPRAVSGHGSSSANKETVSVLKYWDVLTIYGVSRIIVAPSLYI